MFFEWIHCQLTAGQHPKTEFLPLHCDLFVHFSNLALSLFLIQCLSTDERFKFELMFYGNEIAMNIFRVETYVGWIAHQFLFWISWHGICFCLLVFLSFSHSLIHFLARTHTSIYISATNNFSRNFEWTRAQLTVHLQFQKQQNKNKKKCASGASSLSIALLFRRSRCTIWDVYKVLLLHGCLAVCTKCSI